MQRADYISDGGPQAQEIIWFVGPAKATAAGLGINTSDVWRCMAARRQTYIDAGKMWWNTYDGRQLDTIPETQ